MSNKVIAVVVIVLVVLGGFFFFKNKGVAPTETGVENTMPAPGSNNVEEMVVEEEAAAATQPQVKEFVVEAVPYSFSLSTIEVNKGDTVKITVRNTKGTHDLKIDEFVGAATRTLKAGEEQTITFVADKVGSFQYYCSIGNHRAMGMWGTLKVL